MICSTQGREQISRGKLYDAVASRIGSRLLELKVQVENLAVQQSTKHQHPSARERASDMIQHVDWVLFGLGSPVSREEIHIFDNDAASVSDNPPKPNIGSHQEPISSDGYFRMRIISKMHGFMDLTELLGFAARGIFTNHKMKYSGDASPLRAWRQYLETRPRSEDVNPMNPMRAFRQWKQYLEANLLQLLANQRTMLGTS